MYWHILRRMRPNKRILILLLLLSSALLAGCSNSPGFYIRKHWGSWKIKLETRPHPIQAGHDEFLIHIHGPRNKLPDGMIVRYRKNPKDQWIQAMPDGLSDVFRRALMIRDPEHAKLYVLLQYGKKHTQIVFDLSKTLAHR